ncbi:MAG: NADH:ubiquinone reductase (Na(+)-transporting) subunit B [Deltaproteobacteria bacterium]|nr:NADH:ubiquinone reductase (Na(+)-transporting) subunit B [Deltaproteobacteria bacterium]
MRFVSGMIGKFEPMFKDGPLKIAYPAFEAGETFFLGTHHRSTGLTHVRDHQDTKRLMITVIYALLPVLTFAMWNTGYQGFLAEGVQSPSIVSSFLRGAWAMFPMILTSYAVGGFWEALFAMLRKREIEEGFLVTGMLFPLILAPSTPLWVLAMGVSFGVVIGKEVFGGVGMNILNPALTGRAFIFFTYPSMISGSGVWDLGAKSPEFLTGGAVALADGYTGATPLLAVSSAAPGTSAVEALTQAGYSFFDLFVGVIPGSVGETSALAILMGAAVILLSGVGSWRAMSGTVIGLVGVSFLFNLLAGPENNAFMTLPPHYHLVMGGFAFGAVFMATDPVTAAITPTGKWIYGIGIGGLAALVRVVNPAYPEGMMLAILFMNMFSPLVDYYVVQGSRKRRQARLAAA